MTRDRDELFAGWDAAVAAGSLEFFPTRWLRMIGLVGSLALTVLGVVSLLGKGSWVGVLPTAFFGLAAVVAGRDLLHTGARLIVSDWGIEVRGVSSLSMRIPWELLQSADVRQVTLRQGIAARVSAKWRPQEYLRGPAWLVAMAQRRRVGRSRVLMLALDIRTDKVALAEWLDRRAGAPEASAGEPGG